MRHFLSAFIIKRKNQQWPLNQDTFQSGTWSIHLCYQAGTGPGRRERPRTMYAGIRTEGRDGAYLLNPDRREREPKNNVPGLRAETAPIYWAEIDRQAQWIGPYRHWA